MSLDLIVTGPRPASLVRLAAEELARYAKLLFRHRPRVGSRKTRTAGLTVELNSKAEGLSGQGYALRPVDRRTFKIEGGSPVAVLWGVYDLVECWGVRYELHGDILPDRPGALRLPRAAVVREPDLRMRCFRTYNDFALNECLWPAREYRLLIDQLAKLRYNGILFCVRPQDPFTDLRFRGARKTLADPNFGWKLPLRTDHPGYELFVASGDARHGEFTNPDLVRHKTYSDRIAAARAHARKVFRMAHARGMQCLVNGQPADFDPAIRLRIRELTKPQHKVKRTPMVRIRYGVLREGPDVETGRCMSVNNPVFLDAVAANIQAHIDAFPDADAFFFGSTEFGGSDADCERAWRALDRKYGLNKIKTLPALEREARRHAEDSADRSHRELRSDIVVLYTLDRLLNERGFDLSRSRPGVTLAPGGLAAELHRFMPRIFPHRMPYLTNYGYMPAYIATRTDTLEHDDPESVRHFLVVSAEDDNVGMLPQLTGPAVHKIFEALRSVGAYGFLTRQWLHSNLLPTFHYMGHAAWEKGWTPAKAYGHLYGPICGPRSLPHILRAFRRLERITERMHLDTFLVSFPVPTWITNLWEGAGGPLSEDPKADKRRRMEQTAKVYEQCADDLVRAHRASRPAGRDTLFALERHMRHAVHYCRAINRLLGARRADVMADEARKAGRFDDLDEARTAAAAGLAEAESLMRQACETFAEGVRDRCDLGALATLNSYNLEVVAALARIARAKSEMFSVRES